MDGSTLKSEIFELLVEEKFGGRELKKLSDW